MCRTFEACFGIHSAILAPPHCHRHRHQQQQKQHKQQQVYWAQEISGKSRKRTHINAIQRNVKFLIETHFVCFAHHMEWLGICWKWQYSIFCSINGNGFYISVKKGRLGSLTGNWNIFVCAASQCSVWIYVDCGWFEMRIGFRIKVIFVCILERMMWWT